MPTGLEPIVATDSEHVYRVSGKTSTKDLGATISYAVYDGKKVVLRAIGAGAVNQAVKGISVAQQYVAARGLVLSTRFGFVSVTLEAHEDPKTAILFYVQPER